VAQVFSRYRWLYALWLTNPDTAAQWTPAEIDAIEIGVKSIT
jgi:hypothetical protein